MVLTPAEDSERAFDSDTFDFVEYLSRRLGVGRALTTEVLGHWLTHYESLRSTGTDS
jgi:hypothetical protein